MDLCVKICMNCGKKFALCRWEAFYEVPNEKGSRCGTNRFGGYKIRQANTGAEKKAARHKTKSGGKSHEKRTEKGKQTSIATGKNGALQKAGDAELEGYPKSRACGTTLLAEIFLNKSRSKWLPA